MFLTTPTTEELQELELSQLIDLLAIQTSDYNQTKEVFPSLKEYIIRIQTAIEIRRTLERNTPIQNQQSTTQDIIQPQRE